MTSRIYLYAEVLANIRQVTLYASLQTERNEETRVDITSDKQTVSVTHDGQTASIFLPTAVSGSAKVTIPVARAKELSARLEIGASPGEHYKIDTVDDEVPWPATSLTNSTKLCCSQCHNVIYAATEGSTWLDLPSENWAEMMDFWHCHKPYDNHHGEDTASSKGYGASSKARATKGTGLVDILSFLCAKSDCVGAKASEQQLPTGLRKVQCLNCDQLIGFVDETAEGYRLYKWSLSMQSSGDSSSEKIPVERLICSQLLALIDALGIRKFVVHSGGTQNSHPDILLWVFNPDLRYSSSKIARAKRAMKIFYRPVPNAQDLLDKNSVTMEELVIPDQILQDFRHALIKSTDLLPISARKFQEWDVALLDRRENGKSAQEVTDTLSRLGIMKDMTSEYKALYE